MHVLPQVKSGNLLKEWNSRSTLKMQTFEIGPMIEPAVARPTVYVPMFLTTFSTNMLPSPIVSSTNTFKLLTSPKEITKAEVCVNTFS